MSEQDLETSGLGTLRFVEIDSLSSHGVIFDPKEVVGPSLPTALCMSVL